MREVTPQSPNPIPVAIGDASTIQAEKDGHFRTFGRNVLLKNIGETSRLFQMAFFMVVARRFGPAGLGTLTVLLMVGSAIGLFVGDIGINTNLIARMSASQGWDRDLIASEAFCWKAILSAAAFVLMCAGMYLTRSSNSWKDILAVGVISVGAIEIEFLAAVMNGINRFDSEVWLRIIYRGSVFGVAALVALVATLSTDLIYMAGSTFVIVVTAFVFLRLKLVRLTMPFSLVRQTKMLRESFPVWVTQLAQMTYLKFDVVMLGLLHVVAKNIGWYAAAWKVVDVLTAIPAMLAISALPLLSGSRASTASVAPAYLNMLYVLPFFFVLPLAIGSEWITHVLYGPDFAGTPRILRTLVWALVPIFVHTFLAVLAVATRRQSAAAKLAATASALGILAAVLLVPRMGYEAMATICLVANSIFALAMIYAFRDLTGSTQYVTAFKSLGSALAIYILCGFFSRGIHPLVLVVSGTAMYGAAMLGFGVISTTQLRAARQVANCLLWNRVAEEARF